MDLGLGRYLPLRDLATWRARDLPADLLAGLGVAVLSIPQGVAYALIAGLPPVAGLYAATVPAIVGSLFRSSRFVIAGPTNALSLLAGGAIAAIAAESGASPLAIAASLALLVGLLQLGAGLLRLGALVDYISNPVVLGYITGAGVLIGVGQLPQLTATPMAAGALPQRLWSWAQGLQGTDPLALGVGISTVGLILSLRRLDPRIPGAVVAMVVGIAASMLLKLEAHGLQVVGDIAPVPASLPPFSVPGLPELHRLMPFAVAATVLSLVESTAVARAIAGRTGERLDTSAEFAGQGLSNVAAAFFGGYPISGSLTRSMLNWKLGARSRLSGVMGGLLVLGVVLLLGPLVDHTPVAVLAGLLLIIAWDLVDVARIRLTMHGGLGDSAAFVVTLLGAWLLDLDKAIYLGVVISLVLFLRRARLLTVRELAVDSRGRLREASSEIAPDDDELQDLRGQRAPAGAEPGEFSWCPQIRVLHVEGSLFFGAASELQHVLDVAIADLQIRVLILRLKRCQGLDLTTAEVLKGTSAQMRAQGRHLLLVGMRPPIMERVRAFGLDEAMGADHLFPTEPGWFVAMDHAIARALHLLGSHCDAETCPLEHYLELRRAQREGGAGG